jgi:hypothetical protein
MPNLETLRARLLDQPLFEGKAWRLSPEPWPLTAAQVAELRRIGDACLGYHRALERLYTRSFQDRKLLRNRELHAPWVAAVLDRHKPEGLVAHGRHRATKGQVPVVLRPDLLLTDHGFVLTELDSVPGGVGLTAYLNATYADDTPGVVGGTDMPDRFFAALAALVPSERDPAVAIVVSDEAATYRPEFEWLAETLRARGRDVWVAHPADLMELGPDICVPVDGAPRKVHLVYRFFELFDLANVRGADALFNAAEAGRVVVSPPMRAFQEEKLGLALLHHPQLGQYWRENLPEDQLETLLRIIPRTWMMERTDLPPTAVLHAPTVDGKPIRDWAELAEASQRERNLIIKASGFHETAWGARSVTLGSDVSREAWLEAIEDALDPDNETFHVMQDYHKPARLSHPVFRPDGSVGPMEGRLRLCPYYLVEGETVALSGVLATFCPADKKIIHGMKDAALLPCRQVG